MTDLETFGAHAREMSTAEHKPECKRLVTETIHGRPTYRMVRPDPECPGCVTSTDRALWARLADEVDDYMGRDEEEGLFGVDKPVEPSHGGVSRSTVGDSTPASASPVTTRLAGDSRGHSG